MSVSEEPLSLVRSAALLGQYRFVEGRLFELTGSWAAQMGIAEVQLHLDEVSAQHAWHEELWADRRPAVEGLDADDLRRPSGEVLDRLFNLLAEEATGATDPRTVLAGLYRVVVPRLVTSYQAHMNRTAVATDAPVQRALRLVLRDELEAWRAGESLVQGLLRGPDDVRHAVALQQRLETMLVTAGPGLGLLAWPDNSLGHGEGATNK
jgi:hypothetical protein